MTGNNSALEIQMGNINKVHILGQGIEPIHKVLIEHPAPMQMKNFMEEHIINNSNNNNINILKSNKHIEISIKKI